MKKLLITLAAGLFAVSSVSASSDDFVFENGTNGTVVGLYVSPHGYKKWLHNYCTNHSILTSTPKCISPRNLTTTSTMSAWTSLVSTTTSPAGTTYPRSAGFGLPITVTTILV